MRSTVTFFNFGVLLTALLGLNFNSSAVIDQLHQKNMLADSKYIEYTSQATLGEEDYANKLDKLQLTLHPGTDYASDSKSSPSSLKHCKSLVYRTLKSLPYKSVGKLKHLTLYFTDDGRRGLGGSNTIILRCQNVTDEELVSVLVHEMGHVTDTGAINGSAAGGESAFKDGSTPIYRDDASLEFYGLNFTSEDKLKETATKWDFVSGYAMSDVFEDFAESYNYYVLHGNEFRSLTASNDILSKKYEFLKNKVFNGKEYFNGSKKVDTKVRKYDVTVLPYDMKKFFVI